VRVITEPQLDDATEQFIAAMMTKASDIINQLRETSPAVIELIRQLKTPVTEHRRGVIEDELKHEFRVALKGNVPAGLLTSFTSSFARLTVKYIIVAMAVHGDSIVVYFLCTTIKALLNLLEIIKSRIMDSVFAEMINLLTATPRTVHLYVRDEDFDARLSVLSSAQGWLFDRHLLILKLEGICNVGLKLS